MIPVHTTHPAMRLVLFLFPLSLALAGCDTAVSPNDPASASTSGSVRSVAGHSTLNDLYYGVSRHFPGFAGIQKEGDQTVLLVAPGSALALGTLGPIFSVLQTIHDPEVLGSLTEVRVRIVARPFDVLYRVQSSLVSRNVPEGVVSLQINAQEGVVEVGAISTASPAIAAWVSEAARQAGFDPDVVVVRRGSYPTTLAALTDFIPSRYISGGAQIGYRSSPTGTTPCTLGFNATLSNGVDGFVTNSHCTPVQGREEGSPIYQNATSSEYRQIGTELIDPEFRPSSDFPPYDSTSGNTCPPGGFCRFSDSAFIEYDIDYGSSGPGASIFKTVGENTGSLEIPFTDSYFTISDESPSYYMVEGQEVHKVGQTTGWSSGTVLNVCILTATNQERTPANHWMICQASTTLTADKGDSGSAVFTLSRSTSSARVRGLLWGIDNRNGAALVSHYSDVVYELGARAVHGWVPDDPSYPDDGLGSCPGDQVQC